MNLNDIKNVQPNNCYNVMIDYKTRIHQIERNHQLLALLKQYLESSVIESQINLLKSMERAVKLQEIKIRSIRLKNRGII